MCEWVGLVVLSATVSFYNWWEPESQVSKWSFKKTSWTYCFSPENRESTMLRRIQAHVVVFSEKSNMPVETQTLTPNKITTKSCSATFLIVKHHSYLFKAMWCFSCCFLIAVIFDLWWKTFSTHSLFDSFHLLLLLHCILALRIMSTKRLSVPSPVQAACTCTSTDVRLSNNFEQRILVCLNVCLLRLEYALEPYLTINQCKAIKQNLCVALLIQPTRVSQI